MRDQIQVLEAKLAEADNDISILFKFMLMEPNGISLVLRATSRIIASRKKHNARKKTG